MLEISKNNLRNVRVLTHPKVSQWKLALDSQVPQSRISLIENHLVSPSNGEVSRIAKILKVDKAKIFPSYKKNGKTKKHSIETEPVVTVETKEVTTESPDISDDIGDALFKKMEVEESKIADELAEDNDNGVTGPNPLDSLEEESFVHTETENEEEKQ